MPVLGPGLYNRSRVPLKMVEVVDKSHTPPDKRVALVGGHTLVTPHFSRGFHEVRRARKPRVQPPRARRPRATSYAHFPDTTGADVGAPGLTQTRPSYPHVVTQSDGTGGITPARRQPLPGAAGGFGEAGEK